MTCNCMGGWETYSGHRLDCPSNAAVGRARARIEAEEADDRDQARNGRWVGGTFVHVDDLPSAAEL